jgi:hypothetical protein
MTTPAERILGDAEQQRALAYRAQLERRRAYRAAQEAALRGSGQARVDLAYSWEPVANRDADPADHSIDI